MLTKRYSFIFVFLCLIFSFFSGNGIAQGAEGVCAVVKIEIRQEVTLERQAFDAHMRINNGLTNIPLENVQIELKFTDKDGNPVSYTSDPNATGAKFFYRVDSTENITGNTVAPSTSADLHWMIIPSTGAANGDKNGALYYIGAKLTYTMAGEENVTEVTPDYIHVKPLPDLSLDYFLPENVYGDDAFTTEIEPQIPFNLGLRVKNSGYGPARNLSIESAQPKIIENKQGLLIGFNIEESIVNERPAEKSLRVNLGDIAPSAASMARWVMTCSLSGKFTEFRAQITHADELGGSVTSLIKPENVKTHFLVRDVLVDIQGRDRTRDFLAKENRSETLKVFESDGIETNVLNQSSGSSFRTDSNNGDKASCTLTTPVTSGFMYAKLPDPFQGSKLITSAYRSDGKVINLENIWLSKSRNGSNEWEYFINIFDSNTPGIYKISFDKAGTGPQAPVLQFIPDITTHEGKNVSFIAEASDPNGTIPILSASPLPAGASFTDSKNGTGFFDWTPGSGQAGLYPVVFKASDGSLSATRRVVIKVNPASDKDGDGMDDQWEMDKFSSVDRDGEGDFDNDGISDRDEFLYGTNPLREDNAPEIPVILSPGDKSSVTNLAPVFAIKPCNDLDGDPVKYVYEIFSDKELKKRVAYANDIQNVSWQPSEPLKDNSWYYWRVKAKDYGTSSLWSYGSFFVNTVNDSPVGLNAVYPGHDAKIAAKSFVFNITPPKDPDNDPLTCTFEVFSDEALTNSVKSSERIASGQDDFLSWNPESEFQDGVYYWRVKVNEPSGEPSVFGPFRFTVDSSLQLPAAPTHEESYNPSIIINAGAGTLSVNTPAGADTLMFEADTDLSFNTADKKTSGEVQASGAKTSWNIAALKENTSYFWRVKSKNQSGESAWLYGKFLSSSINDLPSCPEIENPGKGAWCSVDRAALSVAPSYDPDDKLLKYRFELYSDAALTKLVDSADTENRNWKSGLVRNNTRYFWRVQAVDASGTAGPWCVAATFFVKNQADPEPEKFQITVKGSISGTKENIKAYLFKENNSYTGTSLTTSSEGKAELQISTITPGKYKFRIDYMGKSFWSDILNIPGQTALDFVIPEENVSVNIVSSADAPAEYPVYVFSSSGSYLGINAKASGGSVQFVIPSGLGIKFRADILGNRYWSEPLTVTQGQANNIGINAAGGKLRISVSKNAQEPLSGIKLYLFSSQDAYLGVQKISDSAGKAEFSLTKGSFKIRADYLGYKFWSEVVEISGDCSASVNIPHSSVTITAESRYINETGPLKGVPIYIFTPDGAYTQLNAKTDDNGQAVFNLPAKDYKIRADYMAQKFWSDVFNQADTSVIVPIGEAGVRIERLGQSVSGVRIYAYNTTGSYLGQTKSSDDSGMAAFRLPPGDYLFRADYQGIQFWSGTATVEKDAVKSVQISLGGGAYSYRVEKAAGQPIVGARCYLFSESGHYLNENAITNSSGEVSFDLASGTFKIRTDYMGASWWSEAVKVPDVLSGIQTIPHKDLKLSVNGAFKGELTPVPGINTYLFSPAGSYLNIRSLTDAAGQTVFNVPETVSYKIRADYLNQQYFSDVLTGSDSSVTIPMAKASVNAATGKGVQLSDLTVYVFNSQDSYLGISGKTDSAGNVSFRIPAGSYKFRTGYLGSNYWSETVTLAGDEERTVPISTGGGTAHLTVSRSDSTSIEGVKCYVFRDAGSYINISGITSSEGKADFELADGNYKIRVDYLGYQFWTHAFSVPADLNQALVIPHSNITLTVRRSFEGQYEPVQDANIYLFSPAGSYLNSTFKTDNEGRIVAKLPDYAYKFRVDYSTKQYWVEKNSASELYLDIPMADAKVRVGGANGPVQNAGVYVFSAQNTYLNQTLKTDANGLAVFRLPLGDYKFRADYMAGKFWSQTSTLNAGSENTVDINTGGGSLSYRVVRDDNSSVAGTKNYVFSDTGTYLNVTAAGDANGECVFRLPDGSYKVRTDYMGYKFWSQPVTVPSQSSSLMTIPHQNAGVSIRTKYADNPSASLSGAKVYLFTSSGTYLNQNSTTPEDGTVQFLIPDQGYKSRIDKYGYQFWTDVFGFSGTTLTLPLGSVKIHVTKAGSSASSQTIYVYTQAGAYTGISAQTDSSGDVAFFLPTKEFKFRAGVSPNYIWSDTIAVAESVESSVQMSLGQ